MKKRLLSLLLVVALVFMLTSCGIEPAPTTKNASFNFSVTYEQRGEVKTISGVFVCEFTGYDFTLEGGEFVRTWDGHIEGVENLHDTYYATVSVYEPEDGGEVLLNLGVFAAHFMGEPDFAESVIEPEIFVVYTSEDNLTAESWSDDAKIEDLYGIKIIDYYYDPPIENSFKYFGIF
jgi:hypothetical protein